jgi:hypothetical protein
VAEDRRTSQADSGVQLFVFPTQQTSDGLGCGGHPKRTAHQKQDEYCGVGAESRSGVAAKRLNDPDGQRCSISG